MGRKPVRLRVPPGLEALAEAELIEAGCHTAIVPGGVVARRDDLARVVVHSRIGAAVTLRMGTVARQKLPDALRGMPWHRVLVRGQRVETVLRGVRSRGLERRCAAVIARGGAPRGAGARLPPLRVWLVAEGPRVEVAVEAARALHKRGWRERPGRAPLRENLAAAVLRACGWDGVQPLVDPMCGSGTFGIEAARMALGLPAVMGKVAATFWPDGTGRAIEAERSRLRGKGRCPPIVLADRDPAQLDAARTNAARARVDRRLRFVLVPFAELEPPGAVGTVVLNPPYGERLAATERTYRHVGRVLQERWGGYTFGVLLPDPDKVRHLPVGATIALRFTHGGRPVWLATGRIRR